MSPEKTAKKVANELMAVLKEAEVTEQPHEQMKPPYSSHRAPSGKVYLLKAKSYAALKRASVKLAALMDGYPVEQCITQLVTIAVTEKDLGTPLGQAHGRMLNQVMVFLRGFQNQGEGEVVFAVRGIDSTQGAFQIGPCSFYLMDEEQFGLWGRRFTTRKYEPLAEAPIHPGWLTAEATMKGQVVAAVKVRAVNYEHAMIKGRNRIEEAINLLRYGQLVVGFPEGSYPEIGFWIRQWQHEHRFAVRIDHPDFATHQELGGTESNRVSMSNQAPGWSGLERVIGIDRSGRNEIQLRLATALQWIGQAAIAPSTSIRLVALVTALEALLIDDSESAGKKTKLASRISALVAQTEADKPSLTIEVEEIYRNRSECVHGGEIEVDPAEMKRAVCLVAKTIEAIVTKSPYSTAESLRVVLDQLPPSSTSSDGERLRWITDNAYFRWLAEDQPEGRELQHWVDAEREYLCNAILKGRSLNSIGAEKQAEADTEVSD